jgi:hypothetical protein
MSQHHPLTPEAEKELHRQISVVCLKSKDRRHKLKLVDFNEPEIVATYECKRCGFTKQMHGIACGGEM